MIENTRREEIRARAGMAHINEGNETDTVRTG